MDIRTMQYYLAVVREGTISAAAQALHIAQPSLSRQMKELEDELGAPLFVRGNRKITLTEEGMVLRKRAEEILSGSTNVHRSAPVLYVRAIVRFSTKSFSSSSISFSESGSNSPRCASSRRG